MLVEGEYNSSLLNREDLKPRTSDLKIPDFLKDGYSEPQKYSTHHLFNEALIRIENILRAKGLFKIKSKHRKISQLARTKKFPVVELLCLTFCCFKKKESFTTTTLSPAQRLGLI